MMNFRNIKQFVSGLLIIILVVLMLPAVYGADYNYSVSAQIGGTGNVVEKRNTPIPVKVTVKTLGGAENITVNIRSVDNELVMYSENFNTKIPKASSVVVNTTVPGVDKYGFYKLKVSVWNTETYANLVNDEFEFCLVNFPQDGILNSKVGMINHIRHTDMGDPLINLDFIKKAGFSNTRSEITWAAYEKTKGVYNLTDKYKNVMEKNNEQGIGHLEILGFGNSVYGTDSPPSQNESVTAYTNYAPKLLGDLEEILKDVPLEVEVWNEFNNPPTFNHDNKGAQTYANLLMATYKKLDETYPDTKVWAMSTLGVDYSWIINVLKNCKDEKGNFVKCFDGISVHPYTNKKAPDASNNDIFYDIETLKRKLADYGCEDVPLRATEWGWPAYGKDGYPTEEEQASYYVRMNVLNDYHNAFEHIDWYTIHDSEDGYDAGDFFGMLRNAKTKVPYGPKPVYLAASNYNGLMADASYVGSVKLSTYVTAYRYTLRDGRDLMVAWKAGSGTSNATIKLGTEELTYMDIYGNESEIESHNGIYTITYGKMPVYIIGDFKTFERDVPNIFYGNQITAEYDSSKRRVNVYGSFADAKDTESVSIMVVPENADVSDMDFSKVLYFGEVIAYNGIFGTYFEVDNDTYGKYKLYAKVSSDDNPNNISIGYVADGNFNMVCSFDITDDKSNVTATAYIKNTEATEKKATLFIAQYDKDNTLVSINSNSVIIPPETEVTEYSVSTQMMAGAVYTRGYIWDNVTGTTPLVNYIERCEN